MEPVKLAAPVVHGPRGPRGGRPGWIFDGDGEALRTLIVQEFRERSTGWPAGWLADALRQLLDSYAAGRAAVSPPLARGDHYVKEFSLPSSGARIILAEPHTLIHLGFVQPG